MVLISKQPGTIFNIILTFFNYIKEKIRKNQLKHLNEYKNMYKNTIHYGSFSAQNRNDNILILSQILTSRDL